MGGLSRGVFRWHLPTALLALSVAQLNPPITTKGRRGGWCTIIALGVIGAFCCFIYDAADVALELFLLLTSAVGLLDIGHLKAVVERSVEDSELPRAGDASRHVRPPLGAAHRLRRLGRTGLVTLAWAVSAAPLAVIGILLDLRYFGVRPTARTRRYTIYRRLLLLFFAIAVTATSVAAARVEPSLGAVAIGTVRWATFDLGKLLRSIEAQQELILRAKLLRRASPSSPDVREPSTRCSEADIAVDMVAKSPSGAAKMATCHEGDVERAEESAAAPLEAPPPMAAPADPSPARPIPRTDSSGFFLDHVQASLLICRRCGSCMLRGVCLVLSSIGICCAFACAILTVFAMTMGLAAHDPHAEMWAARHAKIRGVNLGGWLVMERWMVDYEPLPTNGPCGDIPSPFDVTDWRIADEHDLSAWRREAGTVHVVEQFRDCFITRDDVAQIRAFGLNSVRLPFGWWVAAETEDEAAPFIRGRGLEYIDDAVRWAKEFNLTVMLDLHGAVGSQNGKQTSGLEDGQWRAAHFDAERTIGYLAKVAERYAHEPHVIAIELVNEPELPTGALLDFYRRASDAIRAHMPPERVAVVVNLYRSWEIMTQGWASFNWHMPSSRYPNLIYDLHLYYAFHDSLDLHLNDLTGWLFIGVQTMLMSLAGRPAFVGEWSMALPWYGNIPEQLADLTPEDVHELRRGFAARQIDAMTSTRRLGGYWWSWKLPFEWTKENWDYAEQIALGTISPGQWAAPPHELVES